MKNAFKIGIATLIVLMVYLAFRYFHLGEVLTLENLKAQREALRLYYEEHQFFTIALYMLVYVFSVAVSIPGATVLTLAAGVIFGFWLGTLLVSIASTVGATLAFWTARFFLRDWVQSHFRDKFEAVNRGIEKDGAFYLFTLRLVPIFPFFMINLVMALTPVRSVVFFFVSQLAMLPGTMAYVNAGTQLSGIQSLHGILSLNIILSFALIGVLPLVSKWALGFLRRRKALRRFKRPKQSDYNLVVIGAGSAGLVSAYIASAVRAKVALIEKHKMGGDCLNTGCVPSKTFLRSAKIASYVKRAAEFGIEGEAMRPDFAKVMERVQRVIHKVAPHDSVDRYTQLGVECFQGEAKIRTPYEVEINGRVLTTRSIIIATGAGPLVPPIPGLDKLKYLTSDNVWDLRTLPKRLLVLGGGPIGCELAQAFARFGSQVTQVEMLPRLLAREDSDVSMFISDKFRQEGITVLTGHKAREFRVDSGQKLLICDADGREVRVKFDEVLLALGRKPNTKGFGLEDLGVEISKSGTISNDAYLRTNFPNIYVCGDVAGPYQFTHTAAHQAWYASVNALFSPFKSFRVNYQVIPWATFTDPEVARVGLNEQEAREKGIPFEVTKYEISDLDRAIAEEEDRGFVKVLSPPGEDRVLGATIVGSHAGELIAEYVSAMKLGFGLNKILGTIHVYPTFSEANKYTAGSWKKAHAPEKVLRWVERLHAFRRGH